MCLQVYPQCYSIDFEQTLFVIWLRTEDKQITNRQTFD